MGKNKLRIDKLKIFLKNKITSFFNKFLTRKKNQEQEQIIQNNQKMIQNNHENDKDIISYQPAIEELEKKIERLRKQDQKNAFSRSLEILKKIVQPNPEIIQTILQLETRLDDLLKKEEKFRERMIFPDYFFSNLWIELHYQEGKITFLESPDRICQLKLIFFCLYFLGEKPTRLGDFDKWIFKEIIESKKYNGYALSEEALSYMPEVEEKVDLFFKKYPYLSSPLRNNELKQMAETEFDYLINGELNKVCKSWGVEQKIVASDFRERFIFQFIQENSIEDAMKYFQLTKATIEYYLKYI